MLRRVQIIAPSRGGKTLATLMAGVSALAAPAVASAQTAPTPFTCNGVTYQIVGNTGDIVTVDLINGDITQIGSNGERLNATAYNPSDNFAYGLDRQNPNRLVQIGSNGETAVIGAVTSLPNQNYNAAGYGPDGFLHVRANNNETIYRIDVAATPPEVVSTYTTSTTLGVISDFALNPLDGLFYGSRESDDVLVKWNPATGVLTDVGPVGGNLIFGAIYGDAAGNVYGIHNQTGLHYQFNTSTGAASVIGSSVAATQNDGFSCPSAVLDIPEADLVTVKTLTSGNALAAVGETVTFQIQVTNNGPSIATDAVLTDLIPAGLTPTTDNGDVSQGTYNSGSGIWEIGDLANGNSATITIEGEVTSSVLGATVQNVTTAAEANQPDTSSVGDDLEESIVVANPLLQLTKEADDDEFVTLGQVVTYTYRATNTGNVNITNVTINDVHNGAGPAPTPAGETLTTDSGTTGDSTDVTANDGVWSVLAPGDIVTFTGTYIVQQADIDNLQ